VFPGGGEYHDPTFPTAKLTMLASKTTTKDRWRQIVKEADRISEKHLITLEPSLSEGQTQQMAESKVRLVVPQFLAGNYTSRQRSWIVPMEDFTGLVLMRQR